ncbi:hypothetical protein L1887_62719 [Cichorium endivia]|nr:hypothetical protein L1887_62719 [Cichorium endivia]
MQKVEVFRVCARQYAGAGSVPRLVAQVAQLRVVARASSSLHALACHRVSPAQVPGEGAVPADAHAGECDGGGWDQGDVQGDGREHDAGAARQQGVGAGAARSVCARSAHLVAFGGGRCGSAARSGCAGERSGCHGRECCSGCGGGGCAYGGANVGAGGVVAANQRQDQPEQAQGGGAVAAGGHDMRNQRALEVVRRIQNKLSGRDFNPAESLTVAAQIERLVQDATVEREPVRGVCRLVLVLVISHCFCTHVFSMQADFVFHLRGCSVHTHTLVAMSKKKRILVGNQIIQAGSGWEGGISVLCGLLLGLLLFGRRLLERQQLLAPEGLVVDLGRGLDEILQMGARKEVAQMDKLAVAFVLDIDHAVPVLPAPDLFAIHDDRGFGADNGKGDEVANAVVEFLFLHLVLFVVKGIDADFVVLHLGADPLLEQIALVHGERVGLCNDGDNVDDIAELLHHRHVDGTQSMTRGVDEEEAAVDAGIDNVSIAHRGEFLSQVGRVLVLDVLDDGVPAVLVVHLVAVTGSVDNVQSQLDAVFDNHVRDGVDLGGLTNHLVRCKATLGVDEPRLSSFDSICLVIESNPTYDCNGVWSCAFETAVILAIEEREARVWGWWWKAAAEASGRCAAGVQQWWLMHPHAHTHARTRTRTRTRALPSLPLPGTPSLASSNPQKCMFQPALQTRRARIPTCIRQQTRAFKFQSTRSLPLAQPHSGSDLTLAKKASSPTTTSKLESI